MTDHIFTTRGLLPAAEVELRETCTHEDEYSRVVRVDKHLVATGEWVGNDLHCTIKKGRESALATATL
jgi:hypothetical protein